MQTWNVTITGADDDVDPKTLADLSREFPFVEWGLLFSYDRMGLERYPSRAWRDRLRAEQRGTPGLRLSAHLCGTLAKLVMGGEVLFAEPGFSRIQLNGFMPDSCARLRLHQGQEIILQVQAEAGLQQAVDFAQFAQRSTGTNSFSLLFDPSGGRGVESFSYPPVPLGLRMGYAGGIGPSNVLRVLGDIIASNGICDGLPWIDMESGIRTDKAFDLAKVRSVLEQVAKVNKQVRP